MGATTRVSAIPAAVDLGLYQGDDFSMTLTVTDANGNPITLTGTVAAQIRASRGSATIAGSFTASMAANVVTLSLPASVSTTLPQLCVWDCAVTQGGVVTTLAGGRLELMVRVTV
jgi:H+/gluconate symporter-like permease